MLSNFKVEITVFPLATDTEMKNGAAYEKKKCLLSSFKDIDR